MSLTRVGCRCADALGWQLGGLMRPVSGGKPRGPPLPMLRPAGAGWGAFIRTRPWLAQPRLWRAGSGGVTRSHCRPPSVCSAGELQAGLLLARPAAENNTVTSAAILEAAAERLRGAGFETAVT